MNNEHAFHALRIIFLLFFLFYVSIEFIFARKRRSARITFLFITLPMWITFFLVSIFVFLNSVLSPYRILLYLFAPGVIFLEGLVRVIATYFIERKSKDASNEGKEFAPINNSTFLFAILFYILVLAGWGFLMLHVFLKEF